MTDNDRTKNCRLRMLAVAGGGAVLAVLVTLGVLFWTGWLKPQASDKQAVVHHAGHDVMPFDLHKTTHIFEMTESGGVQHVIAKDANDGPQIEQIRRHLQHEAMQFAAGNFSDPMSLHGTAMPGVKELAAGAARVRVEYHPLPDGAQIVFTTADPHLLTALHRWFGAQLSDHGADATYR